MEKRIQTQELHKRRRGVTAERTSSAADMDEISVACACPGAPRHASRAPPSSPSRNARLFRRSRPRLANPRAVTTTVTVSVVVFFLAGACRDFIKASCQL